MGVLIREYGPGDAEPVAALLREVHPYLVVTPRLVHVQVTGAPARQHYRLLVAEDAGRITGCVRTGLFADSGDPGPAFVNVTVRPAGRRRGAGSALLAAAEAHLAVIGATTFCAWATDAPQSHAFAERHGYRPGRGAGFLRLDLAADGPLPPAPAAAPGVRLLPAALWADDPRPLYEADLECIRDEPGDVPADHISFADWRSVTWDRPDFDAELTTVAVVDGEVAALVIAQTDGVGRYWSGGTGVRRPFRGLGLAKAAKARSLHVARTLGCREAFTSNDDGNAPMLAVNRWLGYLPCGAERRYLRDLPPAPAP